MPFKDKKAYREYKKANYRHLVLDLPKSDYEKLKGYCSENGITMARFIRDLIDKNIPADGVR